VAETCCVMDPARQLYNDGFAAGLQARAARNGSGIAVPATAIPEPVRLAEPPATFEERVKRELHPLDAFPRLLECADANLPPDPADRFRFEWFGLTYLAPAQDGFRLRLRAPGGLLRTHQVRELAETARQYASGGVELNADAGLDLQTITLPDAPEALRRAEASGLSVRGAGGDNVVAVLTDPLAGMAPGELVDVTAYAARLEQCLWQGREFADLPGACRIVFSGGGGIDPAGHLTGDIQFAAQSLAASSDNDGGAAAGFRLQVGGLGDLGTLLRPDQVVHAALELLRFYLRGADRSERTSALSASFFAACGRDACLKALEGSLGCKLTRSPPPAGEPGSTSPLEQTAWADLRCRGMAAWPQRQAGLWAIGLASPPGGWLSAQWEEIAHLADLFGCGRLRLTTSQAIVIPGVFKVGLLEEKLQESGLA
jgi:ferredoxin-nitrite reductase